MSNNLREEIDQIMKSPKNKLGLKRLRKKIPECPICGVKMEPVGNTYIWKPRCDHGRGTYLSRG